jgi:DNA-binding IclR family transcriptional regulator
VQEDEPTIRCGRSALHVDFQRHTSLSAKAPPSMIQRMTSIMEAFEHPQSALTLEEVASRASLPRSTTHRILEQLVRFHWVRRRGMSYHLGQRALELGDRWVGQNSLRKAAAPHLHELAARTDMVAHLAILHLQHTEICLLDTVVGRIRPDTPTRMRRRLPAHCTALGKAILASLEPDEIDTRYAQGVTRCTTVSVHTLTDLHRELAKVRAHKGLAVERGQCFADLGCVAMVLRGPVGAVGAVSVSGDLRNPALDRVAPIVAAAARKIEADVGRSTGPT